MFSISCTFFSLILIMSACFDWELRATKNSVICATTWFLHRFFNLPYAEWKRMLSWQLLGRHIMCFIICIIGLNISSYFLSSYIVVFNLYSRRRSKTVLIMYIACTYVMCLRLIASTIVNISFFTIFSMCLSPLSALNHTSRIYIGTDPLLAITLSLFFPISINLSSSLLSSGFTMMTSVFFPLIFMLLISKNSSAISVIFFALSLLLAIYCVSSMYADATVLIIIFCLLLLKTLSGYFSSMM
jgi:hypothetical protein